jgi:hypothetical protein
MTRQPNGRQIIAWGAAICLLLVTGCDVSEPYPPTPSTDAASAQIRIESLPSLEETTAQIEAAIGEITRAAGNLAPGIVWTSASNTDKGNCEAPYEQTEGKRYFLPNQVAPSAVVSEDAWSSLLAVVRDAAAKLGAVDVQVISDRPRNHDVWFSGPAGLFIKISYKGNLVVAGYTGCRLPQDKKRSPNQ